MKHLWIYLAIQKEIHSGVFAVMDGTTAGNGPGPRTMIPVEKNVILASADQVAIDSVSAKMMGFDPLSIKYINLANQCGLGCGDPREIKIVGDDISNEELEFFCRHKCCKSRGSDILVWSIETNTKLFFPNSCCPSIYSWLGNLS